MPQTWQLISNRSLLPTFLDFLESGKPRIEKPEWLHFGEGSFSHSQLAPSQCLLTWWKGLGCSVEPLF